jgi:hypothetical protein
MIKIFEKFYPGFHYYTPHEIYIFSCEITEEDKKLFDSLPTNRQINKIDIYIIQHGIMFVGTSEWFEAISFNWLEIRLKGTPELLKEINKYLLLR